METLYRKVSVSEEKPKSTGFYWIENIVGEMKSSYYDSMLGMFTGDYANFWLKPAENPTAQLKADKVELLHFLKYFKQCVEDEDFIMVNNTDEDVADNVLSKMNSLIQKHKQ